MFSLNSIFNILTSRKLENYKQINLLYKKNYEEKEFSEFEKYIFNTKNFTLENYDLEDEQILISLANYYQIHNMENNELMILNKLIKKNNETGYIKYGNYYAIKKMIMKNQLIIIK
jgi:hypothetical protein